MSAWWSGSTHQPLPLNTTVQLQLGCCCSGFGLIITPYFVIQFLATAQLSNRGLHH